jgi:DNA-binding IclR family transcriptional regulator
VRVIASADEKELGQPGTRSEQDVLDNGQIYYGKDKGTVSVLMPLRDRNGDVIAAVRVVLKPIFGQTEQHALGRVRPIVREMQAKVLTSADLFE